jgi:uncharacterized protein YigE (DUF2233 family)
MRCVFYLLCCSSLLGCLPVRPSTPADHPATSPAKRAVPHQVASLAAAPPPSSTTPAFAPQVTRGLLSGILFEGVAFDSRSHRLVVADQAEGPGSRWPDAEAAASAYHGLAAINAGFFTPQGEPLGKVVAAGIPVGSWNRSSSLGSGVWLEAANAMLKRREAVPASLAARELIQAGPMLVENHQPVAGLEATKSSVRTVILWDGASRWWIGRASACTLDALAHALTSARPAAWPVRHALNLDGGRSADLAIGAAVRGGPLVRRAAWNRPVRNFLVLVVR